MGQAHGRVVAFDVPDEDAEVKIPSDDFMRIIRAQRATITDHASKGDPVGALHVRTSSEFSYMMAITLVKDLLPRACKFHWQRGPNTHPIRSVVSDLRTDPCALAESTRVGEADGYCETAVVLLGNLPINATTMTVDTLRRMQKAADVYKQSVDAGRTTKVICCGGHSLYTFGAERYGTFGGMLPCFSEAQMMGAWLLANGFVPRSDIIIEDRSMTTKENGAYASAIVDSIQCEERKGVADQQGEVVLVSKAEHLQWAWELYVNHPRLAGARLEGAQVPKEELMEQLMSYSEEEPLAKMRWEYLRDGVTGLD